MTRGLVAIVDADDYEDLSRYEWHADAKGYAVRGLKLTPGRKGKNTTIRMHRQILGVTDPAIQVDHINGYKRDNRKVNLRTCTNAQNQHNRKMHKTSSTGFKGVSWIARDQKYRANIRVNNRTYTLGAFHDAEAAARTYDAAAAHFHGEFARTNFPEIDRSIDIAKIASRTTWGETSKYRGVYFSTQQGKFHAEIQQGGKRHHLGFFTDERDAAKAYNDAAIRLHGTRAKLNILEGVNDENRLCG